MNYELVLYSGGIMMLVSIILSSMVILRHLKNWNQPSQQRNILIIVCMIPLFAINSFIGLLELEESNEILDHVLDMIKECYEAIVLNAFLMLMYKLCGLSSSQIPDEVKGRELHIPFPLSLFFKAKEHPHFDTKWYYRLRLWTMQFMILRPILSIVDLVLVDIILAKHHPIVSKVVCILIAIILNVSTTIAVCSLLTFYHAFEKELSPHRPLAKFVCIKGVVFFATWQGVILKLLVYFGIIHEGYRFSVDEIALAYQDLLVCMEMGLLFAPLCLYAYSPIDDSMSKEKKKTE